MKQRIAVVSALVFSGTLAINVTTAWPQGTQGGRPASPGGTQEQKSKGEAGPAGDPIHKEQAGDESGQGSAQRAPGSSGKSGMGTQTKDTPSGHEMDKEQAGDESGQGRANRAGMSDKNMKKVQEALREKGHDPGTIDGVLGPRTQQALREFQKANGLKATGTIDGETAAALGVENTGSVSGTRPRSPEMRDKNSGGSSPRSEGN